MAGPDILGVAAKGPFLTGILILVIVLIVHVCLYPWQFAMPQAAENPFRILVHSWPAAVSRRVVFDFAANIVLFLPLGVSGYLVLNRTWNKWAAAAGTVALGAALSAAIEMIQIYTVLRRCNTADLVSNACGAAAGVALGILLDRYLHKGLQKWAISGTAVGAALLLCCWIGYQTYPLMPETFRHPVLRKLRQLLFNGSFAGVPLLVATVEWIAVEPLVRAAAGARRASSLFAPLLLLAPARLLFLGRTVTWSELAALPLALLLLRALPQADRRRALVAGVLLAFALLANGLAPFHLSAAPAAFHWIPFQPIVEGDREFMAPILLLKCFRYGALIWLFRAAGGSFAAAAGFTVALLAAIEMAQLYVPGHVAEVTDPLLAAILGLVLSIFERHQPRRSR
jgi:glycopeptide antibiotics resistance protein